MRCPSCGARNAEHAAWCTQCFAALGTGMSDAPAPPDAPTDIATELDSPAAPAAPPADATAPREGNARDIRTRDGGVQWRCATCDGWAALEAVTCPTCGSPRTGFGTDPAAARPDRPVSTVVAASLLLPGAGHVLAGSPGTGIARAILALLWLGGGYATLRSGGGVSGGILLLGAGVLWILSAIDAAAAVTGTRRQLLGGRRLGALVVAITLGLVVAITYSAFRAAA